MSDIRLADEDRVLSRFFAWRFGLSPVEASPLTTFLAELERDVPPPPRRWQDRVIQEIIPAGTRVLDLGCGSGELLARLAAQKGVAGQGVEIDEQEVAVCLERGVPVIQSDLDGGLKMFTDAAFDYVVLEETLQTLHRPAEMLSEMLRVGRHGIVSFPNFAYWRVRLSLALGGTMPVTRDLPWRWYDTPNIHLFTIRDFLHWAEGAGVKVVAGHSLVESAVRPFDPEDNLMASEALFVVTRG